MTIRVDLSNQEYSIFDVENNNRFVEFKSKNFIFGKNGRGKSTLCEIITKQFENEYDVRVFNGFDNILEDERLNAVVLGKENIKANKDLKKVELELSELAVNEQKLSRELNSLGDEITFGEVMSDIPLELHPLLKTKQSLNSSLSKQKNEVDTFLTKKAKQIKELDTPRVAKPTYFKNDFLKDVSICNTLDEIEKERHENILIEKTKGVLSPYIINDIEVDTVINRVNHILQYMVEEKDYFIKEINYDSQKKEFAQMGLKIHEVGENCSFCGNEIKEERLEELRSLISVDKIKSNEMELDTQYKNIEKLEKELRTVQPLRKDNFYTLFHEDISKVNDEIEITKKRYESLLSMLKNKLNEKSRSSFEPVSLVESSEPISFIEINAKVKVLIEKNNALTENLTEEQEEAKNKLRLHHVATLLKEKSEYKKDWKGYEIEKYELSGLKKKVAEITEKIEMKKVEIKGEKINPAPGTINYIQNQISSKEILKKEIIKQTKNTSQLVDIINDKLKRAGKNELELILQKDEHEVEHYQIKDGDDTRPIDKLSTGEKNIIAFLYFLESLSDLERKTNKPKIVIFDDPMNSNDDTMQYLIITEIQKLYRNNYQGKFNSGKDYFICLTHNVHFYLNVQPYGNFKKLVRAEDGDGKEEKDKYQLHGFYRIEQRNFKPINSEKEDFNTHYACLWLELGSLYSANLVNSMLNSMRRIIETYLKFNQISADSFYKNNEQHRKLFDVNSHSIDDHSMEALGKEKEELVEIFENLFIENGAAIHFRNHWKKTR